MAITVAELGKTIREAAEQGRDAYLTEGRRGAGVLRIRVQASGRVSFYYRYTTADGKRKDHPIGIYSATGRGGLTLEQARDEFGKLALLYRSGIKDIGLHLEAEQRRQAAELKRQAEERERQEAGSLAALLDAYVGYLRDRGKPSWKDVASIFRLHIAEPFPDLAQTRANEIGPKDLRAIFDRLQDKGFTRALGKTRAALHSAYNLAAKSEFDSTIPAAFRLFKVAANPVASLPTYSQLSKPGERVLSPAELRALLAALHADKSMAARALLVGLYLGGQRPTQLARVRAGDVDVERGTITLRDGKGRRQHPRLHVLPLEPVAEIVAGLLEVNGNAPSIFSSDGKTVPHATTLSKLVRDIGEGKYQLRDVRRTAETELARLGVAKDIRAQILSHELGGIQTKHYDRHQYLDEKRQALRLWRRYLDGLLAGSVVAIARKGAIVA
ncbi:integrase family protein [Acidithiobacillus sp.]|uniref:tyrosine-type recombinase/integrase n=1 Tax=Acidithiobacillus sp. TaxID=1872118 RepID=UPI0025BAE98C|nr:integrase family protein [Acidithiobacillus sp.]